MGENQLEAGQEVPAGEEGQQKPEAPEGFISLEDNQQQVNKQHRKFRDEERLRARETERANKLEQELAALKAERDKVEVPPVPDPDAENYAELVVERDKAIARKAELGAAQTQATEKQEQEAQERLAKEEAAITEKVKAFDSNMVNLGLNPTATKEAADTLVDYGVSDQLQDVLLEDPDGPLFVMHLANNPVELEKLNKMSALQLVNHLNGEIRAKASLLKPKTSDAPDPPVTLDGAGVGELQEEWEKGAVYD